jgi:hypothetical protein
MPDDMQASKTPTKSTHQCKTKNSVQLLGATIKTVKSVKSPAACCARCAALTTCSRWTYSTKTENCLLKKAAGWRRKSQSGYVSGRVIHGAKAANNATAEHATTSPSPLPSPARSPSPSPSVAPVKTSPPLSRGVSLEGALANPSSGAYSNADYAGVLGLSWLFYESQRSGGLPANYRVPWRRPAHLNDTVVGGW